MNAWELDDTPMTVGDLRALIADLPDGTPFVEQRHSDYGPVEKWVVQIRKAVRRDGGRWFMRDHKTLPATERVETVLYFAGN